MASSFLSLANNMAIDLDRQLANGATSAATFEIPMASGPIGVFDSGVGGLSVVRHIQQRLPQENLLYFADSGYAPYGEKHEAEIVARSFAIAQFLLAQGAKALVVACNTATIAAIKMLREHYSELALVGVEPGIKPAAALSVARRVGVLATKRTLSGEKFSQLQSQIANQHDVQFFLRAATGLVELIERGELHHADTRELLTVWLDELIQHGVDAIVLGCTHYPFVQPLIEEILRERHASHIQLIDTGDAVAKQLQRLLQERELLAKPFDSSDAGKTCYFTSGKVINMQNALRHLLQQEPQVDQVKQVHVPALKVMSEI